MAGFFLFTAVLAEEVVVDGGPLDGVPPTERVTRCPGVSVVDKLPTSGTIAGLMIGVDSLTFTAYDDEGKMTMIVIRGDT